MDEFDFAFGFLAYMAYLNDPTDEAADELAAVLAGQHSERLNFEDMSRELRRHASEIRLMSEADMASACNLLGALVAGKTT